MTPQSLSNLGLEKLASGSIKGSGSFATVYEGISPNTIIKRGTAKNDGWLIWALYCMTHGHNHFPCLPDIQMLHVDFGASQFTALMERLIPSEYTTDPQVQYRHGEASPNFERLGGDMGVLTKHHIDQCLEEFPVEADVRIDMHKHNMMIRPSTGQHVITDPFSYLHEKGTSAWEGQLDVRGPEIMNLFNDYAHMMPDGLSFTL